MPCPSARVPIKLNRSVDLSPSQPQPYLLPARDAADCHPELWTDFPSWLQTCLISWACCVIPVIFTRPDTECVSQTDFWPHCYEIEWPSELLIEPGCHLCFCTACLVQAPWGGALPCWLYYHPQLWASLVLSECVVSFHRYCTVWLLVLWLSEKIQVAFSGSVRTQNAQQFPGPIWLKIAFLHAPKLG